MGNGALNANPSYGNPNIALGPAGSDWLWAVFAIMTLSTVALLAWIVTIPAGKRTFHWIGVGIVGTATIAYFSMASNLGQVPIEVEFTYAGQGTRSIWYARYIDWTITTPLLLLELLLATGLPLSNIFGVIYVDIVMIITGLIGALVASQYKWGFFVFGCMAELLITYFLIFPARAAAKEISSDAHKAYLTSAIILNVLWFLYPVAWGLCDGGNVIGTNSEMYFYGVLDVLAKPVFLFYHLFALSKCDYDSFGLSSGHFTSYSASHRNEYGLTDKSHASTGINGHRPSGETVVGDVHGPPKAVQTNSGNITHATA